MNAVDARNDYDRYRSNRDGGYFDEMDAFNPIAIEKELRWQSLHSQSQSQSQHSRASGLLRRMQYKADGIPKVIKVQVESSKSCATSVVSSSTSSNAMSSSHSELDMQQARAACGSRNSKGPQQDHCHSIQQLHSACRGASQVPVHSKPTEIDEGWLNQNREERLVDEVLQEALSLDGYSTRSCARSHNVPNHDTENLSRRINSAMHGAADSGVANPSERHNPRNQAVRPKSHSPRRRSRNVELLTETKERQLGDGQHQLGFGESDPCLNITIRSADFPRSPEKENERLRLHNSFASVRRGSGSLNQREAAADKSNMRRQNREPRAASKYVDLPRKRSSRGRAGSQQWDRHKHEELNDWAKIKPDKKYMHRVVKSHITTEVPQLKTAAPRQQVENKMSYMDSLFGEDGPDMKAAVRQNTLARSRMRR